MGEKITSSARIVKGAFVALLFLQGLSFGSVKKDIIFGLKETRIRELSSKGLVLAYHIGFRNMASSPYSLERYDYRVTVDQKEYLRLSSPLENSIRIEAGEETVLAFPVKVSYDLLTAAIGPVGEKCSCDVVGDFIFRDERGKEDKLPFAVSGSFPIFQDPIVEFLPIRIKDLTVGGGDIVFEAKIGNPNSYDLIVDTIEYELRFGEASVLSGRIPGDKSIPAKGEKAFSLPFLMDFFEVGKGVYDLFQTPPVPCRFSGRIVVNSVWGRLVIAFDKSGSAGLIRPD